jgi:hypothetical protein
MTKNTTTAAKKARKTRAAAKAAPVIAPRTVAQLVGANKGQDTLAILGDDSKHTVTGWAIKVGDDFDAVKAAHLAAARKAAAPLAKGAETERQSKAAVAANRKGAKAAAAPKAAKAPTKAKAERAARTGKAPAKLTVLVKAKDSGLKASSGRFAKLVFAAKCKLTTDFLGKVVTDDAGKEHKCDAGALAGMLKRGHIRLG